MSCRREKFSWRMLRPSRAATSLRLKRTLRRNGSWIRLWIKVMATSRSPLMTGVNLVEVVRRINDRESRAEA